MEKCMNDDSKDTGLVIKGQFFPFYYETEEVDNKFAKGHKLKLDRNFCRVPMMDGNLHMLRLVTGEVRNELEVLAMLQ